MKENKPNFKPVKVWGILTLLQFLGIIILLGTVGILLYQYA